ncbi:MAG: hypothetical protein WA418_24485 [Bradyrhizobium sp.]
MPTIFHWFEMVGTRRLPASLYPPYAMSQEIADASLNEWQTINPDGAVVYPRQGYPTSLS